MKTEPVFSARVAKIVPNFQQQLRVHRFGLLQKSMFVIMWKTKDDEPRTNSSHQVNENNLEAQKHETELGTLYPLAISPSFLLISTFSRVLTSLFPTGHNSAKHGKLNTIEQFLVCVPTQNQILSECMQQIRNFPQRKGGRGERTRGTQKQLPTHLPSSILSKNALFLKTNHI